MNLNVVYNDLGSFEPLNPTLNLISIIKKTPVKVFFYCLGSRVQTIRSIVFEPNF